jgi:hypothetical protein
MMFDKTTNNPTSTIARRTGAVLLATACSGLFSGCGPQTDARTIIDEAIATHGGQHYNRAVIEWDFRGNHYSVMRDAGNFSYKRTFEDLNGRTEDILDNDGFTRSVNDVPVQLSDRHRSALANSLNSIIYFATLPFPLNDPAVIKKYLGSSSIKGQSYHKIQVTFKEEGGGKDFRDTFVYWIHKTEHTVDYLAYRYGENRGGSRFREAYNIRTINQIRFADYHNYTADLQTHDLAQYDLLFETGQTEKVSDIILENIQVRVNE